MEETNTYSQYGQSLLWISFYFAFAAGLSNIIDITIVDFVHTNPHRTKENAASMMETFTVLFGVIAFIGSLLVFTVPQFFQAFVEDRLRTKIKRHIALIIIAILPVTSILTWYCWEYLTPTDFNLGINDGPDWRPYQHGLTWSRYVKTLYFQVPATLFSLSYRNARHVGLPRWGVVITGLILMSIAGAVKGYLMGEDQLRFL